MLMFWQKLFATKSLEMLHDEMMGDNRLRRVLLSYAVAGVACALAAFCYSEFASMAPVAGSAYTYAYATLGELFAWIIGWDLILEYAVASSVVAHGWSA